jgi:hypothetical protein
MPVDPHGPSGKDRAVLRTAPDSPRPPPILVRRSRDPLLRLLAVTVAGVVAVGLLGGMGVLGVEVRAEVVVVVILTVGLCAVDVWIPWVIPHGLAGAAESRRPGSSGERSRFAPQEL